MAPFVSKLLSPPPSHVASTWSRLRRRLLLPRATSSPPNPSPAYRPIAPPAPSRSPARRFATSCASASSDRAGATTTDAAEEEEEEIDNLPFVQMSSDILQTELSLLKAGRRATTALENGGRLSGGTEEAAAYPAAMNALYAACLAGTVTEQLWNFTWPAAIATLHPSGLLPVAVLGFFSKLVVFAAGPLVGDLVSSLPRIPAYRSLAVIQTAAHLVSAAMVTYAFTVVPRPSSASALLLQPWFAALVASTAVDRLSSVSLGVIAERDFVVQLAGEGRPIALAKANATLSRVDLLCETAGASIFAVLFSRNDAVTCIKLSCFISLCALPLVFFLGGEMNRLADGVFDHDHSAAALGPSPAPVDERPGRRRRHGSWSAAAGEAWETTRRGWTEYLRQPVLPASLAYVLVCFNVALAPGALMTTFLIHHDVTATVLGAFGGSSAAVGILATFVTPYLVKELGILKAGAVGLVAQSVFLAAAVVVFFVTAGSGVSRRGGALFAFLGFIVASRLGHMAYSVIGLQVVQTGNPMEKAKLIGATEIAVASLSELAMMAVATVAGDAAHFGCLAALSAASVAAAAGLFCAWLANATDDQDPHLATVFGYNGAKRKENVTNRCL